MSNEAYLYLEWHPCSIFLDLFDSNSFHKAVRVILIKKICFFIKSIIRLVVAVKLIKFIVKIYGSIVISIQIDINNTISLAFAKVVISKGVFFYIVGYS